MPPAPKRVCTYPGCTALTTTGRCNTHRTVGKWGDPRRGTRQERGYGSTWDKLRLVVLARDRYLCQCEQCQGGKLRLSVATEVDHRISKAHGGTDALDNLQAINRECHRRKTAEETGKTWQPRLGPDGYAIE